MRIKAKNDLLEKSNAIFEKMTTKELYNSERNYLGKIAANETAFIDFMNKVEKLKSELYYISEPFKDISNLFR